MVWKELGGGLNIIVWVDGYIPTSEDLHKVETRFRNEKTCYLDTRRVPKDPEGFFGYLWDSFRETGPLSKLSHGTDLFYLRLPRCPADEGYFDKFLSNITKAPTSTLTEDSLEKNDLANRYRIIIAAMSSEVSDKVKEHLKMILDETGFHVKLKEDYLDFERFEEEAKKLLEEVSMIYGAPCITTAAQLRRRGFVCSQEDF